MGGGTGDIRPGFFEAGRIRDSAPLPVPAVVKRRSWWRYVFGRGPALVKDKSYSSSSVLEKSYSKVERQEKVERLERELVALRGRMETMEHWTGKMTDRLEELELAGKALEAPPFIGGHIVGELTTAERDSFLAAWDVGMQGRNTALTALIAGDSAQERLDQVLEGLAQLAGEVRPEILDLPIPHPVRAILLALRRLAAKAGNASDGDGGTAGV